MAVVVTLTIVDLVRIRAEVQRGRAALKALDFDSVDRTGGIDNVAAAAAHDLERADHLARTSPWLSLWHAVPGMRAQVDAVRDMTGAAARAGDFGRDAAHDVQTALDAASGRGPEARVPLVDAVAHATDRLRTSIETIDVDERGWLLPGLSGARHDLDADLHKADRQLGDAQTTLATLRSFLVGPRRYLILGGNNAEMRSVGIATTSGVATVHAGAIDVSPFRSAAKTTVSRPGVPLPPGWDPLYGFLDPNIAYANMVMSPDFPLTGQTAAALSARNVNGPVDGVIYVDTVSLQVLLDVVGPVTVDGVTYDSTNATRILINENYLRFPTVTEVDTRRDAQGRVASAIFDALQTRPVSLVHLAAKLQLLARTRHMLAWSSIPAEEQLWTDVGADGSVQPDDLDVTVQDLGADKLDYYIAPRVAMDVHGTEVDRVVDLAITVTNPPRPQTSAYIEGYGNSVVRPGEYGAYTMVFLPSDAYDVVNRDPGFTITGTDGPLKVIALTYAIPIGQTKTVTVSFHLPASRTSINVLPASRLHPGVWTWGATQHTDLFPFRLDLDAVGVGPARTEAWLLLGLLLFGIGVALAGDRRGRLATAEPSSVVARRARIDFELGWWIVVAGLAMMAVDVALVVLR